jgi:hypothetical protein
MALARLVNLLRDVFRLRLASSGVKVLSSSSLPDDVDISTRCVSIGRSCLLSGINLHLKARFILNFV